MKKLIEFGNRYAQNSDWADFALVKLCLCAIGVIIGTGIPDKFKTAGKKTAECVFVITYVALIFRLIKMIARILKND